MAAACYLLCVLLSISAMSSNNAFFSKREVFAEHGAKQHSYPVGNRTLAVKSPESINWLTNWWNQQKRNTWYSMLWIL